MDPAFERNWSEAQAAGFICGALHYFRPDVSPSNQASYLLSVLSTYGFGQLPPVLDAEVNPPPGVNLFNVVFDYLDIISQNIIGRPALYTSPGFWASYWRPVPESDRWLLWVAHWNRYRTSPTIPQGFPSWHFWQWLSNVNKWWAPSAPGITGDACPDRFNGSYDDLVALTLPAPPPTETYPVSLTLAERSAIISIAGKLK